MAFEDIFGYMGVLDHMLHQKKIDAKMMEFLGVLPDQLESNKMHIFCEAPLHEILEQYKEGKYIQIKKYNGVEMWVGALPNSEKLRKSMVEAVSLTSTEDPDASKRVIISGTESYAQTEIADNKIEYWKDKLNNQAMGTVIEAMRHNTQLSPVDAVNESREAIESQKPTAIPLGNHPQFPTVMSFYVDSISYRNQSKYNMNLADLTQEGKSYLVHETLRGLNNLLDTERGFCIQVSSDEIIPYKCEE